jgi:hypothetical protein
VTGFVPARELSRAYYDEVLAPVLDGVPHAAASLGAGSDVLGYDTERSADHGWGPRVQVFVDAARVDELRDAIDRAAPSEFRGRPNQPRDGETIGRLIEVTSLGPWLELHLGFDPRDEITTRDWLTTPQQLILEVTAGAVFHDDAGELSRVRDALGWYPHDVWLWLMASQWQRIGQEEPFVGRTAEVGDDLGSGILVARLVRDVMRLCFLQERRYAPYSKWLGTAFSRLAAAEEIGPMLGAALAAPEFAPREAALVAAYEAMARRHNALGVTPALDTVASGFYSRPFRVIRAERFAAALQEAVTDPWLRARRLVGSVDQFADSTDVLSHGTRPRRLGGIYDGSAYDGTA